MKMEDVEKLLAIIDESHFTEVNLQIGDIQLFARKGNPPEEGAAAAPGVGPLAAGPGVLPAPTEGAQAPGPVGQSAAAAPPAAEQASAEDDGYDVVRAPMLGVFYRAPSPGEEPFAKEGQEVSPGDTIGSIEVMKLFTSIAAGTAGVLDRFLVGNGEMVEYDQPLAVIRPASS